MCQGYLKYLNEQQQNHHSSLPWQLVEGWDISTHPFVLCEVQNVSYRFGKWRSRLRNTSNACEMECEIYFKILNFPDSSTKKWSSSPPPPNNEQTCCFNITYSKHCSAEFLIQKESFELSYFQMDFSNVARVEICCSDESGAPALYQANVMGLNFQYDTTISADSPWNCLKVEYCVDGSMDFVSPWECGIDQEMMMAARPYFSSILRTRFSKKNRIQMSKKLISIIKLLLLFHNCVVSVL